MRVAVSCVEIRMRRMYEMVCGLKNIVRSFVLDTKNDDTETTKSTTINTKPKCVVPCADVRRVFSISLSHTHAHNNKTLVQVRAVLADIVDKVVLENMSKKAKMTHSSRKRSALRFSSNETLSPRHVRVVPKGMKECPVLRGEFRWMLKICMRLDGSMGNLRGSLCKRTKNVCFVTSRNLHIDVCIVERIARADMAFKFIKTSGVPRTTSFVYRHALSCFRYLFGTLLAHDW